LGGDDDGKPRAMDDQVFETFAAAVDSPMVIVTAAHDGEAGGCLVGFSTQCSIDPTRFLVCLSKRNQTFRVAREARVLVVHTLHDTGEDRVLAHLFGEETGFETEKLARCAWDAGPDDTPVLRGLDHFVGGVVDRVDLGDHIGFVLDVRDVRSERGDETLLGYQMVKHLDAGNPA
jgi:flavin reductase (DIM6/NTAB) family NADH-FMN oxidoreductase RutF